MEDDACNRVSVSTYRVSKARLLISMFKLFLKGDTSTRDESCEEQWRNEGPKQKKLVYPLCNVFVDTLMKELYLVKTAQ